MQKSFLGVWPILVFSWVMLVGGLVMGGVALALHQPLIVSPQAVVFIGLLGILIGAVIARQERRIADLEKRLRELDGGAELVVPLKPGQTFN
jgi:hypothetical protein